MDHHDGYEKAGRQHNDVSRRTEWCRQSFPVLRRFDQNGHYSIPFVFFLLIISLVAGVVAFQRQDVFTDAVNKALGVATLEFALHSHGYLIVHVVG